ncbi:MAG: hypothetical protein DRQ54_11490 [Gammaproteobacteria bacterium]|nr:MAG: hypothetical protein DRQ54_11490 [Gammaproteobacteria bacterium]
MESFNQLLAWLTANEALLSSGAAIVVNGGLVFTTLAIGARALAYTMQGDLHHAEEAIRRSIDENAVFSTPWFLLARIIFGQNRNAEILAPLAEARRLDPAITLSASIPYTTDGRFAGLY